MSIENDANSFDKEIENAQGANSQDTNQGTQENENSTNDTLENVAHTVDYQKKFSESSKEALRLVGLQKEKDAEIERLQRELELKGNDNQQDASYQNANDIYPGFENMDEDTQRSIMAYTDNITRRVEDKFLKNPAIAHATKQYNEQVWDSAFGKTIQEYPELASSKEEFKSKYFNVNNVPENIESILKDVAKIHLYDKAREIGAKEATEKAENRVDIERTTSGMKDSTVNRTLEDWQRMSQENPTEFAKKSKEFNEAMASGKI